jgi:hypothetical protein
MLSGLPHETWLQSKPAFGSSFMTPCRNSRAVPGAAAR